MQFAIHLTLIPSTSTIPLPCFGEARVNDASVGDVNVDESDMGEAEVAMDKTGECEPRQDETKEKGD
ncbi:hypothetical protein Pmani_011487 [Petrolisthes manimaculis]|uniref:Uncharacterized protein n=1 Tax=Petrolisthes manimaculis TaxID=1843537 RepID=A0AAE1Q0Z5_9EUCA|nr:hypothetical protein Pmani_011487 [Petrolisthes manimaculis]